VPRRAVFLDRDGTIHEERDFLSDPALLRLERGAAAGLRRLEEAGFALIVITNQSGVARGYHTEDDVRRVNAALSEMLAAEGVHIESYYHCPHHPEGAVPKYSFVCDCRKPAPGLILQAAKDADIDIGASYMVGDFTRDVKAGRAAGVRTVLVRTGYGRKSESEVIGQGLADYIADDLADAAEWIIRDSGITGGKGVDR